MSVWNEIVRELSKTPRDIQTVPLRGKGKWFRAYSDGANVFVMCSKEHSPSCKISKVRKLDQEHCVGMTELYHRRRRGESVSREACDLTRHQVYWYGIFSALDL